MKRTFGRYFILLLSIGAAVACENKTPDAQASAASPAATTVAAPVSAPMLGESKLPMGPDCEGDKYYCQNINDPAIHDLCKNSNSPIQVADPETGNTCYCHCGTVNGQ